MFSYTTKNINIISFIISIIIFISLNHIINIISKIDYKSILLAKKDVNEVIQENNIEENKSNTNSEVIIQNNIKGQKELQNTNLVWKIEIPAISLSAEISEGTTKEIMDKYVGHFTNTSKQIGNIGLAAHNRGYQVNYFQNIKKLKKGDEIKYQYNNFKKTYIVDNILIIDDTDWSKLEQTEENVITLITCVENEPLYRRCIQGTEK